MTFEEALVKLNIEDYGEAIWNSHSNGELSHCYDYICLAEQLSDKAIESFREWFIQVVGWASKEWTRPASVYQPILRCWNSK
jgi:hypothetical protein